VTTWANDFINSQHWVYDPTGQVYYANVRDKNDPVGLTAGLCTVSAYAERAGLTGGDSKTTVYYKYRWYNQFSRPSLDLGWNWGTPSGPLIVDDHVSGSMIAETSIYRHEVYIGLDNELWYKRLRKADEANWTAKLTNTGQAANPVIVCDSSNNSYVAWEDMGNDNKDIFFQKVPLDFAPIKGTPSALKISLPPEEKLNTAQTASFEAPVLVAPVNDANVTSLRPTFSWQHHKLDTQDYKLDLAKNDSFTIEKQTLTKDENAGSPDKDDPALYHYKYAIHDFDAGLDRDIYYWRVTANATSEAATSEVRSFTVAPELTLTGVTNYPNPFDPNREATRIRYRLGADADQVKIRIYDVVGSLVREIDNCPTEGEGSSVWQKYHDVDWNGRNGRGDIVVNGIYPFEVIARLGGRSVSGRGKVAVLK
jgi:hypothetical protein